ncbi:MAG: hypothetical protein B6D46_00670 [Polyangiaceae bacterium UTPRO1]|jgi:hypothetical protein|nr:hypothetical protein [Myxococcales bacterium]OQY69255.1 MAG: hypothetical protein B6D46_00670 [Polyangiaceae bacterium UTPRO1]
MSDEAAASRDALRAAGIADDETAPDVLLALAGRTPALDRALAERLATVVDAAHAAALRDLAAAAAHRGWKAAAKEARRALYRFGQRGVVPPAPAAPAAAPAPRWAAPALEGWASGIDGRGDRLVWIVRPQPGGGLLAMTAILNEPRGLREVQLAELSRKSFRALRDELVTRQRLRLVALDGAYCDALLAAGYERARAGGAAEAVGQYPALRARLTSRPPAPLEPPMIARVAPAAAQDTAAIAAGAKLLDEVDFATWLLDRATLAPYLEDLRAARASPILVSQPLLEERVQAVLTRAERELFAGPAAAPWRRRLEEMAFVLHATGRPEFAAAAAATAASLGRGEAPLPFSTTLLRRSVDACLAADEAQARAEAESSVLVRPGQPRGGPPPYPPRR